MCCLAFAWVFAYFILALYMKVLLIKKRVIHFEFSLEFDKVIFSTYQVPRTFYLYEKPISEIQNVLEKKLCSRGKLGNIRSKCPSGYSLLRRELKLNSKIAARICKKVKFAGVSWFFTVELSKVMFKKMQRFHKTRCYFD